MVPNVSFFLTVLCCTITLINRTNNHHTMPLRLKCAVRDCFNATYDTEYQKAFKGRFFHFPSAEQADRKNTLQSWLVATSRDPREQNFSVKNARVCSIHFPDTDLHTLQCTLQNPTTDPQTKKCHCRLPPDTVPSLQLPGQHAPSQAAVERDQRSEVRERRKLVEDLLQQSTQAGRSVEPEEIALLPVDLEPGVEELDMFSVGSQTSTISGAPVEETIQDCRMEYVTDEEQVASQEHVPAPPAEDEIQWPPTREQFDLLLQQLKEKEDARLKAEAHAKAIKERYDKLQVQCCQLMERLKDAEKKCREEVNKVVLEHLMKVFTRTQALVIMEDKKFKHWKPEDIARCTALHSMGPRAYRYLKNKLNFPLPHVSTLRRWARRIDCSPGIQNDVLTLMKIQSDSLMDLEKLLFFSFDEAKISEKICYDQDLDQVQGPCKYVQVGMVRSVVGSFKQPVFYGFDTPMTKAIFYDIVEKLYENGGYTVVASTSDMGPTNRGFWKEMGVNYVDEFSVPHPQDPRYNIHFFADVPHLLKLLRNHFLDSGFLVNGELIDKNIILQTIRILRSKGHEVRMAHKLTEALLGVEGRGRQRVKPAAQLFSHTTSAAVEWCGARGLLGDLPWKTCAKVFKLVNDWFDVNNVRSMRPCGLTTQQGFGMDLDTQQGIIKDMKEFTSTMRVRGHRLMLPFQKGIFLSCNSLLELYTNLTTIHCELRYILTYRLNQDIVENYFSTMRACGATYTNPLPTEFKYRFRNYILARNPDAIVEKSNCIADDSANSSLNITDNLSALNNKSTTSNPPSSSEILDRAIPLADDTVDSEESSVQCLTVHVIESLVDLDEKEPDPLDDVEERAAEPPDETAVVQFPEPTEEDEEEEVEDFSLYDLDEEQVDSYLTASAIDIQILTTDETVHYEGMRYLAGYIAYRLRAELPDLGQPTGQTLANPNDTLPDWIRTLSKGGLIEPSLRLVDDVVRMEKLFVQHHGKGVSKEVGVIKNFTEKVINSIGCHPKVARLFSRTRLFIRIRHLNEERTAKSKNVSNKAFSKYYN